MVVDEVQTGFARTGKLFAIEHFDVEPDLITVAKSIAMGLPLSGVLGKAEIMDAPPDNAVGGTYVGNPVAQAAALAVLDVIEDEGLCERSAPIGETIRARMEAWQERWPAIGDVRGLGAMLALELVADRDEGADAGGRLGRRRSGDAARAPSDQVGRARELHSRPRPARRSPRRSSTRRSRPGRTRSGPCSGRTPRAGKTDAEMVGEVLAGRYELEELVARADVERLSRARPSLDRMVAVKVLHEQYSDDEDYVERFRREARSVAALSHPNIVTVIDRGEHGGRQFIVFEYIDGENLKTVIQRGARSGARALELAIQVARGLSFAHQRASCIATSNLRTCS